MHKRTPSRRATVNTGQPERRVAAQTRGIPRVLRLLKNLWARPLGLKRHGAGLKLVLVDRRQRTALDEPPPLPQVRADLRERLLSHQHAHAAQVMRHLALVHDELGRTGWRGVETLPAQVLGMAVVQAEMLASEGPSPSLSFVAERLRIFKVAAEVREEREARQRVSVPGALGAVATTKEPAFDADGSHWAGPVPVPTVIADHEPEPR